MARRVLTTDGYNLKLYSEGTGTGTVPARTGVDFQYDLITIPHGYGSSELIFQVGVGADDGITQKYYMAPFVAPTGSFEVAAYIDSTNLYIVVADGTVVSAPAFDFDYFYRLLIPISTADNLTPVVTSTRTTSGGDRRVTAGGDVRIAV